MTDPKTTDIFDSLLSDLGPDPDTALSEDELDEIAGDVGEEPAPEPEPATEAELAEAEPEPAVEKPKRGRPRKVVEPEPAQPVLSGMVVGVDLSPQTLAEMEAGRKAISRGRIE